MSPTSSPILGHHFLAPEMGQLLREQQEEITMVRQQIADLEQRHNRLVSTLLAAAGVSVEKLPASGVSLQCTPDGKWALVYPIPVAPSPSADPIQEAAAILKGD